MFFVARRLGHKSATTMQLGFNFYCKIFLIYLFLFSFPLILRIVSTCEEDGEGVGVGWGGTTECSDNKLHGQ